MEKLKLGMVFFCYFLFVGYCIILSLKRLKIRYGFLIEKKRMMEELKDQKTKIENEIFLIKNKEFIKESEFSKVYIQDLELQYEFLEIVKNALKKLYESCKKDIEYIRNQVYVPKRINENLLKIEHEIQEYMLDKKKRRIIWDIPEDVLDRMSEFHSKKNTKFKS